MYSIYHFFQNLEANKDVFRTIGGLKNFPFDKAMFSCVNEGQFPDMAIKINKNDELFTGGELIELKDSKSYSVSSFNSTIPSGTKDVDKIFRGDKSNMKKQMEAAGDNVYSLPTREIYYVIRGRYRENTKVVVVHGSFFETVATDTLISQSFEKVLEERLLEQGLSLQTDIKELLVGIFSEQKNFSKVRNLDKASVKLRFRVMTEVKAEGNILNSKKYPEIKHNTLSLIVPRHTETDEEIARKRFASVFGEDAEHHAEIFTVKHLLNGYFMVFQYNL